MMYGLTLRGGRKGPIVHRTFPLRFARRKSMKKVLCIVIDGLYVLGLLFMGIEITVLKNRPVLFYVGAGVLVSGYVMNRLVVRGYQERIGML